MDKKYLLGVILLVLIIVLASYGLYWWFNQATPQKVERGLQKFNQNPMHYVHPNQPGFSQADQAPLVKTFLGMYFLPWQENQNTPLYNAGSLEEVQQNIQEALTNEVWDFAGQRFSAGDLNRLLANVGLTGFPSINRPGIIVRDTWGRIMPTLLPAYGKPSAAGQGYPFDNWMASLIPVGSPVRILQFSRDGLWMLVSTDSYTAWAPSVDIGFVSPAFVMEWQKHPYLTAVRDNAPMRDAQNTIIATMRKGLVFPTVGEQGGQYQVLAPALDATGSAQIITLWVNKSDAQPFPLPATPERVAAQAQDLVGTAYGWGNLYRLRDCSSTVRDILAGFGFWLPRNTSAQAKMGQVFSLQNLSPDEKRKLLVKQAIPFFSLVHFPGHIALYIGHRRDEIIVLQDVWGIHTANWLGKEGRAVINKTIINSLEFGDQFTNVPRSQLDQADVLIVLTPQSYPDVQALQEKMLHKNQ